MFGNPLALEIAQIAVDEAVRLGASFADARFEIHQHEELHVQNGRVRQATVKSDRGIGVRALVNGAWGFCALSQPTRHDAGVIARRAVELARAAAVVQEGSVQLVQEPPHASAFKTPIERDPLAVSLEDKLGLLLAIDAKLRNNPLIKLASSRFSAHRTRKLYVSSEGSEIDQDLVYTASGYQAGASDGSDFQIRSYPDAFGGQILGRGWEMVEPLRLLDHAERIAEEAVEQLHADPCPAETTSLILDSTQLALQIHESCGHPTELDRVLGLEQNFAGASFLTPDRLGTFEYGSRLVNLYADAREKGGLGTFGFDDEGVEAQRVDLVSEGRFSGYLSSRDSARRVGLERSSGAMRAESYASMPLIRMTNVCLEPGAAGDLEALIADTKSGVLMATNRSWSIDDLRLNFQFGCEAAWEIKNGKRTRRLKNPTYAGMTPAFWRSCDAICDRSAWSLHGVTTCGKGQPMQLMPVGHGTAPARFRDVAVGAMAPAGDLPRFGDGDPIPLVDHPEAAAAKDAIAGPRVMVASAGAGSTKPAKGGGAKRSKKHAGRKARKR